MSLAEFLVEAKVSTYASDRQGTEITLSTGEKLLTFHKGLLKYADCYAGFDPFSGRETVMSKEITENAPKDGTVIWTMNYYGGTTKPGVPVKEIYEFLKKALREVKEGYPFRGPSHFSEGDYDYFSMYKGTIDRFLGHEQVLFRGNAVYHLVFHGGSVKSKDWRPPALRLVPSSKEPAP